MRQWILALLLVAILLGMMLFISTTAQGPAVEVNAQPDISAHRRARVDRPGGGQGRSSSGILQIDNSTVNYIAPVLLRSGLDELLCFNVTVDSPDYEYMDRFDVDLPDGWDVSQVVPVADSGCGSGATEGVEAGNVVYWETNGFPSDCGAWNNGTYDFCALVSVPDCTGEPWSFPWNIVGDGYGVPPHQVSNTAGPVGCLVGRLDLDPHLTSLTSCRAATATFTLILSNTTGWNGNFSLTYGVPSGNGVLTGPDEIYLGHGVEQQFLVDLSPDLCMPAGQYITSTVTATGGGYQDTAFVEWIIEPGAGCPKCNPVFLPLVRRH
jgi:hypothetical protein